MIKASCIIMPVKKPNVTSLIIDKIIVVVVISNLTNGTNGKVINVSHMANEALNCIGIVVELNTGIKASITLHLIKRREKVTRYFSSKKVT